MSRRLSGLALTGVALLAFVVGGTAEAGKLITGRQILDGSVGGRDLRDNSVTGADIADGSIGPSLYDGVSIGPQGPAGETGPTGPEGYPGLPGVRGVDVQVSRDWLVRAGATAQIKISCPYETAAVQGGAEIDAFLSDARMTFSAPRNDMGSWDVHVRNGGSAATTVRGYVVCIAQ